jgi:hypothetical protein
MRLIGRSLLAAAGAGLVAAIAMPVGEAHKPITSKYTFNDDVFPILKERCAQCHVAGGVAPMSLMTYEEAFPWAESIRAELVASHMPPATADGGFGDVTHARGLTPQEIDVLLTWASGGNPRGAIDQKLPAVGLKNDWALGKPDTVLQQPAEFTLTADKMEDSQAFSVPTGLTEPRWVRVVDLLPGNPAIVRSATISLKGSPEQILARWLPGQDSRPPEAAAAFRLPAGAELDVRIRYKKTWSYEGKAMKDRSSVGLYFAKAGSERQLTSLPVSSNDVPSAKGQVFSFSQTIDRDMQALALSPDQVPDNLTLQVEAVRPDGSRTPVIRFNTRPDWKRRYWFAREIALPKGTKIEVSGTVNDPRSRRRGVRRRGLAREVGERDEGQPLARSRRFPEQAVGAVVAGTEALPAEARRIWRIRRRSNAAAAVDFEDDAGDEARFVGCEEHHGVGDVARRAEPSERDRRQERRAMRVGVAADKRRQHRRVRGARADGVDANPIRRQLDRERLAEHERGALAGVVGGQVRPRPNGRHRHGVENHPAALPPHYRHRVLRRQEHRLRVDRHQTIELLLVGVGDRRRRLRQAGVVDDDIEASEPVDRRGDQRRDVVGRGNVRSNEHSGSLGRSLPIRRGGEFARDRVAGGAIEIGQQQACAFSGKAAGDFGANA